MAEVKIDIEAMAHLVSSLTSARSDARSAALEVRSNLSLVWLSAPALDKVLALEGEIDTALRDLNRRLTLARIIEKSTPGLTVVTFDDSVLSTASDAEIQQRVKRVLELMDVEEKDLLDRNGDAIDPELVSLLSKNSLDPYFAKALADRLPPDKLAEYLAVVDKGRSMSYGLDMDTEKFDAKYRQLLSGLGQTLGLASRGTGDLAVPDMSSKWAAIFNQEQEYPNPRAANLLSMVIGQGQWSDRFLTDQYQAIKDGEKDYGAERWAGGSDKIFDPFGNNDVNSHTVYDPMDGLFQAMRSNPDVVRKLFTGGETTTIDTGNGTVEVNKELWWFLHDRKSISETLPTNLVNALGAGIGSPPVIGQTAWQPLLAKDLKNIGDALNAEAEKAKEEQGPLWKQIAHGVLDLVGLIPLIGEPADILNGAWYYADGDIINGSLSMGSAIPFAGYAFSGGKWVKRALSAEELLKLNRLARDGKNIRIFAKDGKILDDVDLADPRNFDPDRFLSADELARWSGDNAFMRKIIAGNRFNAFLNPRYKYAEIALTTGRKSRFRLDAYTPGLAIVSRKLTQLSEISKTTALKYIDEFATKYPAGTKIAVTKKNKALGIDGEPLKGRMVLEVPPQSGKIDDEILQHAFENKIHIVDLNGHDYTQHLFDAHR